MYICICICICIYIYVQIDMYIHIIVCRYVCMYVYTYILLLVKAFGNGLRLQLCHYVAQMRDASPYEFKKVSGLMITCDLRYLFVVLFIYN